MACAGGGKAGSARSTLERAVARSRCMSRGLSREGASVGHEAMACGAQKQTGQTGMEDGPSSSFLRTPMTSAPGGRRPRPSMDEPCLRACKRGK